MQTFPSYNYLLFIILYSALIWNLFYYLITIKWFLCAQFVLILFHLINLLLTTFYFIFYKNHCCNFVYYYLISFSRKSQDTQAVFTFEGGWTTFSFKNLTTLYQSTHNYKSTQFVNSTKLDMDYDIRKIYKLLNDISIPSKSNYPQEWNIYQYYQYHHFDKSEAYILNSIISFYFDKYFNFFRRKNCLFVVFKTTIQL